MRRLILAGLVLAFTLPAALPAQAQEWPQYPYCQRVHNFVDLKNVKGRAPSMQKQNPLDQMVARIVFPWEMCYNPWLGGGPNYPGRLAWTRLWSIPTTAWGWHYEKVIANSRPWGCTKTCNSLAHYIRWQFRGPGPYNQEWDPCALVISYASGWVRIYGDRTGGDYCADLAQGRP